MTLREIEDKIRADADLIHSADNQRNSDAIRLRKEVHELIKAARFDSLYEHYMWAYKIVKHITRSNEEFNSVMARISKTVVGKYSHTAMTVAKEVSQQIESLYT